MASANDAPLSSDAVSRAVALLRSGRTCKTNWQIWSYVQEDGKFWHGEFAFKDNEWIGWHITEEQLRKEIVQNSALFRQMLTDAL